ncbi:MAG TPA: Npt1/Npt2 family nucleotide transporter [Kofleriaceae bacterium]
MRAARRLHIRMVMPSRGLRWLRPFSTVRRSERVVVLLLLVLMFLLLASYYAMKTSREGLILAEGSFGLSGQQLKAYASGAMACLLLAAVPAYSALATHVRRIRLIEISYAVVIVTSIAFYVLARMHVPIGLAFFIWIGLVNVFLVAQFWSYANDLYSEDQGSRLFAIIALGGSLGGVAGPWIASLASTENLLLVSAALLVPCVAIFHAVERRHLAEPHAAASEHRAPIESPGGFSLVWSDRYLTWIAALVFVGALVKTIGEYVLSDSAAAHAAALVPMTAHAELVGRARELAITHDREELIKQFYGNFYLWVNAVSFGLQAFVVSRAIEKLGIRRTLFVMPVIALGAYGAMAVVGGYALVRAAKVAENSTEYSLENTVQQMLFLPTGRAAKYKAKAAIDTFAVRAGDTASALVIWIGVQGIGVRGRGLAAVNVALVAVWLGIAAGVVRLHRRRARRIDQRISRVARS